MIDTVRGAGYARARRPIEQIVPKWCRRCGGKHGGGTDRCDLVSLYSGPGQPPRWCRRDLVRLLEDSE